MYLCGKGLTRFAPMSPAAAELMGAVRSIDSDRIRAMIEKLSRIFAAGGVETSVTEASLKAAVSEPLAASPPTPCSCRNVTWLRLFKRRCSWPSRTMRSAAC